MGVNVAAHTRHICLGSAPPPDSMWQHRLTRPLLLEHKSMKKHSRCLEVSGSMVFIARTTTIASDVVDFYPFIPIDLLNAALDFASYYDSISNKRERNQHTCRTRQEIVLIQLR